MKKALSILLALMLLLTLCACGEESTTEPNPTEGTTNTSPIGTAPSTEAPSTSPTEVHTSPTESTEPTETPTAPSETEIPTEAPKPTETQQPTTHTHSYTETITKKATCKEEGVKTYTCSGCGDSYTESIAKVAHNWKNATCTAPKTCTICGATEGEKASHSYTETVTKKATCKEEGVKTYTCSGCGDSYTESIAKVAHNWKNATCTAPKTCTSCGATEGSAVGHDWEEATYSKPKTCKTCGATEGSKLQPICVSGVQISEVTLDLNIGDTRQLTATIFPSNADNKTIMWSSSNTSVAQVSSNGEITANGAGTATITVTTADGNYTAKCTVTVVTPPITEPLSDVLIISDTQTISNQTIDTDVYITSTGVATFNNVTVKGNIYCYGQLKCSGCTAKDVYAYAYGSWMSCGAFDGTHGKVSGGLSCNKLTILDDALDYAFAKWGKR